MNKLTVGTWNTLNSCGDERQTEALEMLKRLDADVLALQETALRSAELERLEDFSEYMKQHGYQGVISDYSPYDHVRNEHMMSLWSRTPGEIDRVVLGNRYALQLHVQDMDVEVYGVHLDDASEDRRLESVRALTGRLGSTAVQHTVVMGDYNAMNHADSKSFLPRAIDHVSGLLEERIDYYDESKKIQRLLGKVVRVGGMARGSVLEHMEQYGFQEADKNHAATIGVGRMAFSIDHILASDHVTIEDFRRYDKGPSDHHPLRATLTL